MCAICANDYNTLKCSFSCVRLVIKSNRFPPTLESHNHNTITLNNNYNYKDISFLKHTHYNDLAVFIVIVVVGGTKNILCTCNFLL